MQHAAGLSQKLGAVGKMKRRFQAQKPVERAVREGQVGGVARLEGEIVCMVKQRLRNLNVPVQQIYANDGRRGLQAVNDEGALSPSAGEVQHAVPGLHIQEIDRLKDQLALGGFQIDDDIEHRQGSSKREVSQIHRAGPHVSMRSRRETTFDPS